MHLKLVVMQEKQDSLSLNENAHKNVKKGPKMVKKPLFVKLCKPIAPFERSGPKIFVVDSEAHIYEISSYAVKSKRVCPWMEICPKYQKRAQKPSLDRST